MNRNPKYEGFAPGLLETAFSACCVSQCKLGSEVGSCREACPRDHGGVTSPVNEPCLLPLLSCESRSIPGQLPGLMALSREGLFSCGGALPSALLQQQRRIAGLLSPGHWAPDTLT